MKEVNLDRRPVLPGEYEIMMRVVARSIEVFGFIVVPYKLGWEPAIGSHTTVIWRRYKMSQAFVVVRTATAEEWTHQRYLAKKIGGKEPTDHPECKKFVLMTD